MNKSILNKFSLLFISSSLIIGGLSFNNVPYGTYADEEGISLVVSETTINPYRKTVIIPDINVPIEKPVVEWESSNTDVATVTNGVVTGVGIGTTIIKASIGEDYEDSVEITVANFAAPSVETDKEYLFTGFYTDGATTTYRGVMTDLDAGVGESSSYEELEPPHTDYRVVIEAGPYNTLKFKHDNKYLSFIGIGHIATRSSTNDDKSCWVCTGDSVNGYLLENLYYPNNYLGFIYDGEDSKFDISSEENNIGLYKVTDSLQMELNYVNPYFGLGYSYEKAEPLVDIIDRSVHSAGASLDESIEMTDTTSGATYLGYAGLKSLAEDAPIRISAIDGIPHPGITAASNDKYVSSITIYWNQSTPESCVLNVYGKDEAYSSTDDLVSTDEKGTKIGEIAFQPGTNSTTLSIPLESMAYHYIAFDSPKRVAYIDRIEIAWSALSFTSSDFRLRVGVDAFIGHTDNNVNYQYGVEVSTSSKTKKYYFNDESPLDAVNGIQYQVIGLGDVLAEENRSRLTEQFTIKPFIEYDNEVIYSKETKTESVVSLIQKYYNDEAIKGQIERFYSLLKLLGYIS